MWCLKTGYKEGRGVGGPILVLERGRSSRRSNLLSLPEEGRRLASQLSKLSRLRAGRDPVSVALEHLKTTETLEEEKGLMKVLFNLSSGVTRVT